MKKFIFLLMAATISIGAFAQGKSQGKGNGKHKQDKHYSKKQKDSRYDRDGNYDNERWDNQQRRNQQGKVAKNIPTPVSNAFSRDFPNPGNVSWTKDRGIWTAHFGNSGIFNRNNSVSYRSNGQRVDGNYAQQNRNYPANTNTGNGSILDKILNRN